MYYLFFLLYCVTIFVIFYLFVVGYVRYYKLDKKQDNLALTSNQNYHEYFKKVIKVIIRLLVKRVVYYLNFFVHYLLFIMLKIVYIFNVFSEKFYANLRNYVIIKSVKDKSYIKFFWRSLKKYKRERDQNISDNN